MATTTALNWTDYATATASVVATATILVGLVFAYFQLRLVNKGREIEAITDRSRRWEEDSMIEARLAVSKIGDPRKIWETLRELEPGATEEWYLYMRIPHFFEDVGVATLNVKALKIDLVYNLFEAPIEKYWGYYETFVKEHQKRQKDESLLEWFEKLALEISEMKRKRDGNV